MLLVTFNILFVSIILLYIYKKENKRRTRADAFKNYDNILIIFETAKNLAYQKIFRDDVLVQTSSGFSFNTDEIDKMQRNYIKITLTHCGPKIEEDLVLIHGNLESLCVQLCSDLVSRLGKDEAVFKISAQQGDINTLFGGITNGQ